MAKRQDIPDILGQERQKMTVMDDLLSGKPVVQVAIASIRIDGGTQMRAALDDATVFEYTQAMAAADGWGTFPPVVAFYDGTDYWLGDGFHRVAAFRDAFTDTARKIPVDVRAGTRRDAILHAAGANANHGLRRKNEDKRRSVETLLRDEEWGQWPQADIARRCNVTPEYVSRLKKELSIDRSIDNVTVTRNGVTYTQNVANIGKRATYESTVPTINVVPSEATGSRQQGAALARCIRCGRPLSDPASAIAGVGPCCAAKRTTAAGSGTVESEWRESNAERVADMDANGKAYEAHYAKMQAGLTEKRAADGVTNYAPEDLAALGWWITYKHEDGTDKYQGHHQDYTRRMWGYYSELSTLVARIRDLEARLDTAATPAGSKTDNDEEQPLQLATVDDDEATSILTPDRPKSSMAVHFSSESPEHYTPSVIIDAAIACMGGIDLDPCSNSKETPNVPAATHYTREDDGLSQEWRGCVYMNPPYGREIDDWVAKLVSEYEAGNVTEAIALVPSRTDTQWWQRLREYHVCLVSGRLKFIGNNDSAPFPSAVFYLGQNIGRFVYAFEDLGDIWHRTVRGVDYGD